MNKDSLGDRMKRYEASSSLVLPWGFPVILRLDGKSFHTYTRACQKPFDDKLSAALNNCAIELCKEIHGAQFAYLQSDEISILIHGYKTKRTTGWFENKVQKMCSVAASIAAGVMTEQSTNVFGKTKRAAFDARVFIVPERDVVNAFIWRQKDWERNSVQMLARAHFSHKQCHKKNNSQLQDMLMHEHSINWNDLPTHQKRGRCVVKQPFIQPDKTVRSQWVVDWEIPIFTKDRQYIEQYLVTELD